MNAITIDSELWTCHGFVAPQNRLLDSKNTHSEQLSLCIFVKQTQSVSQTAGIKKTIDLILIQITSGTKCDSMRMLCLFLWIFPVNCCLEIIYHGIAASLTKANSDKQKKLLRGYKLAYICSFGRGIEKFSFNHGQLFHRRFFHIIYKEIFSSIQPIMYAKNIQFGTSSIVESGFS